MKTVHICHWLDKYNSWPAETAELHWEPVLCTIHGSSLQLTHRSEMNKRGLPMPDHDRLQI